MGLIRFGQQSIDTKHIHAYQQYRYIDSQVEYRVLWAQSDTSVVQQDLVVDTNMWRVTSSGYVCRLPICSFFALISIPSWMRRLREERNIYNARLLGYSDNSIVDFK